MPKVYLSPQAKDDLAEIKEYIAKDLANPQASVKVLERIVKRIHGLSDFPLMGAPLSAVINMETKYRYLVCGNYTAFYHYENDEVYVNRVLYGRRDFVRILFGDVPDDE